MAEESGIDVGCVYRGVDADVSVRRFRQPDGEGAERELNVDSGECGDEPADECVL
jgi:hypothetical protein